MTPATLRMPASAIAILPGLGWAWPFAAPLLGGLITLGVFGVAMLNPFDAGWMLAGAFGPDPVQYWLGWRFFAQAPWSWPPGLSPAYGMELSSSVFYADSIPLLALPLKLLAPDLQQYWGLWLLVCGMAQGWFGWVLMGHATRNPLARLMGAGLMVLQPMLLNRMAGHLALAGQWTVLAALALALRPPGARRQALAWMVLVPATALVHAYLLVMVAAIWAADWLRRALDGGLGRHLAEALAVPAAALLALWLAGFFALAGGHGAPGYGAMMLDLTAPLNPAHWGGLLPALPQIGHPESGGIYLGLGGLLLLAGGLLGTRRAPPLRLWPLGAALLAMLAFAITPRVAVLGHVVELFTLPAWAEALASSLRASERFAWPMLYLALVAGAVGLAQRLGSRRTGLVMAALLGLQAVDLRPGFGFVHGLMAQAQANAQARSIAAEAPFWAQAAALGYHRLRAVPAGNQGAGWEAAAVIAARHGMATDAVYLARIDAEGVAALVPRVAALLRDGRHEPGTLYILRDAESLALAQAGMNPARDLLTRVGGVDVLAPGWLHKP